MDEKENDAESLHFIAKEGLWIQDSKEGVGEGGRSKAGSL